MKISVVVLAWFVLLTQETQPENPLAMSWWTSLNSTLLSFPDGQRCRRLPPPVWCKTRWLGLNRSGGSTGSDPPKGYSSWIPRSELVRGPTESMAAPAGESHQHQLFPTEQHLIPLSVHLCCSGAGVPQVPENTCAWATSTPEMTWVAGLSDISPLMCFVIVVILMCAWFDLSAVSIPTLL